MSLALGWTLGWTSAGFSVAIVAISKHLPLMFRQECLPFALCEVTECNAWHPSSPPPPI